jgi:hypothetical protein
MDEMECTDILSNPAQQRPLGQSSNAGRFAALEKLVLKPARPCGRVISAPAPEITSVFFERRLLDRTDLDTFARFLMGLPDSYVLPANDGEARLAL